MIRRTAIRLVSLATVAFVAASVLFAVPSYGGPSFKEQTVPLVDGLVDGAVRPLGADGEDPGPMAAALRTRIGPVRFEPGWSAEVDLPFAAPMVNLTWTNAPGAAFELRSFGPEGWSDWVHLHHDVNEAPDDTPAEAPQVVGPVWVGDGTTKVQLRVESGTPVDLAVTALDVEWPEDGVFGRSVAGAAPSTPGFISRAVWGAGTARWVGENPGCENGPQYAPGLRRAVVHHTVNTNNYSEAQAPALVLGIWRTHTGTNGWCDIGYNFLIDRFGRVYEGRTDSIERLTIGGHAAGWNTNSTGIALLGQHQPGHSFGAVSPSPAAWSALTHLIVWKFQRHGTDAGQHITEPAPDVANGRWPTGTPVTLPAVIGHRDVNQTSCPGELTYRQLDQLRFAVWGMTAYSGPHHPRPTWTPNPSQPALQTVTQVGDVNPVGGAQSLPVSGHWGTWHIIRDAVGDAAGGYLLDAFGGLHPFGNATPVSTAGYWPGWDIARGVAPGPSRNSGYVVDGWGAPHPFGGAPRIFTTGYWPGWDIARDIATMPSDRTSGYVLDGWGGLHPFGNAPKVISPGYWPGWDVARAVVLRPDGPGGWVLDAYGGMHPFGGAPRVSVSHYTSAVDHVDAVALPGNRGYVLDADGRVWPFGGAPAFETVRTSPTGGYDRTWTGLALSAALIGPSR